MDPLLKHASSQLPGMIDWIRGLVEIESPSHEKAAVDRAVEYVADRLATTAKIKIHRQKTHGGHLRAEFLLPGRRKQGQVLGLGHLDTVWPVGTLERMPFRRRQGRLWGPGVFDMKAGVAFFVFAAQALRELGVPVARRFVLQLNSDEEIGSPSSRRYTDSEARKSTAVLVAEPSWGLDGCLKTARKGGGDVTLRVQGRAAHSGLDFEKGASAVLELSRQLLKVAEWSNIPKGITVNPGVIRGGTATNVVPADAAAEVDVRASRGRDLERLTKRFAALQPFDKRTRLEIDARLRRPPIERTAGNRRLFRLAKRLGAELGVDVGEASVGGGSDGNFTSALGVPTLDGLGAVGEGAHAAHESILVERIADRVALIAKLIAAL